MVSLDSVSRVRFEECKLCGAQVKATNMERHIRETCPKGKRRKPRGRKRANRKRLVDSPGLKFVESKWFYRSLALGLAILLIIALVVVWPKPPARLEIGQTAPEITWPNGKLSEYACLREAGGESGKCLIILIHFYDQDSPASVDMMPILVALYDTWTINPAIRGDDFFVDFLSIEINAIPPKQNNTDVLDFKLEHDMKWQVLLDNGQARLNYFIKVLPTFVILDHLLNVRQIQEGTTNYGTIDTAIFNLVKERNFGS